VAETSDPMMAAPAQGPGLMAQAAPASPEGLDADTDTFETMVAGLIEFIYGQGQKGIAKQLKSAKNLPQTVGMVTLQLVKTAADQASAAGREFDLDMVLGCATEIIDSLFQMARALKLDVGDPEQAGAEALFVAIQAYQASTPPGSEEQEAAKAMLAQMQQDGSVDEGVAALQEMGAKAGVDPFAAEEPQQTPLAQGVRAGLMGGMPNG
jgi:hypothetical protein